MNKLPVVLMSFVVLSATACSKKEEAKGACVFDYDDLGGKGTACTVDAEARCKAGDEPQLRPGGMATLKLKEFTAGKTCEAVGYTTGGCADVAIAWAFQGKCPQ
ncbi:MAG TPA: hypothetical protein VGM90_20880 [Kofleriaceae bacterium]|jgi:hypothetical protein